ncbi:MAG: uracil-DNA glycosylase [Pseudomonadota bacterium]|nr:uracil-DNA glycosylase [Pseudomonadota bacterium]
MQETFAEPNPDCPLCPRLVKFRDNCRKEQPTWFNSPVPSFGSLDAQLLIVGLAPGLRGANKTGRPFTGDFAGDLLYETLHKFGFSTGFYAKHNRDDLSLSNCRICNAVRCVPPKNKPIGAEVNSCGNFLKHEIGSMLKLRCILALGGLSHGAILSTLGQKKSDFKFAHGAIHIMPIGLTLVDSYHCSRYNTNTGRLTKKMFESVFLKIQEQLK